MIQKNTESQTIYEALKHPVEELIEADDELWEETLDRLFDMEIDNENHASEKTARRDRIVSDLITMMTEEAD